MEPIKDFNIMVGLRIREIRESMELTREQFSIRCDISESFLTAVESGKKSITSKTLYKLCTGANVSADYIIFGKEHGYDMDTLLEIFNGLDAAYRPFAVKILSAYAQAIHQAQEKGG